MALFGSAHVTAAGSTTLPISSLYASATTSLALLGLSVFNTGAAAVGLKLVRLTTLGTAGAGQVEANYNGFDPSVAVVTCFTTHTVAPTLGNDLYRFTLPAGGGVIIPFDPPIVVAGVANAGLGLLVSTGTGQICDVTWQWRE